MKIVLIYPRFRYKNVGNIEEPLGILYIAAVLKRAGHQFSFYDLTFAKDLSGLDKDIGNADLVGFSSSSPLFGIAKQVLAYVKKINPGIKSVIGGPHSTQDPADALKAGFDFAVIGEGETVILDLIKGIENGKIEDVKGIAYNQDGAVRINSPQQFIEDLDAIPLLDRGLLDYSRYFTFGLMATRGCPFNCFYCKPMQDQLFGNRLRRRSAVNVVDEIEGLVKIDRNKVIYFKDDTLTVSPLSWFREFGEELKRRNLHIKWGCNSRVDTIDQNKLELMKRSGCVGLSFGVESGSQKIIDFYKKGTKIEQVVSAFSLCHKLKLKTLAFIMLGAPVETRQDMEQTLRLIKKIKPDHWITYIATPFPGNYLHAYANTRGIIKIDNCIEYDNAQNSKDLKLPMALDYLSKEDIAEYRNRINRYMIKRTILLRLWGIITCPAEFKKLFLEAPKAISLVKTLLSRF